MYGHQKSIRLTLGHEFEIVETLQAHKEQWVTIPEEDLQRDENECPLDHCPSLEVSLNHPILKDNLQILIPPDCLSEQIPEILKNVENILPVIIYAITDELLNDKVRQLKQNSLSCMVVTVMLQNIEDVRKLKEIYQDLPILFVCMSQTDSVANDEAFTESERHQQECKVSRRLCTLHDQLSRLGEIFYTVLLSFFLKLIFLRSSAIVEHP